MAEEKNENPLTLAKVLCEFVGTYLLVFTVGCNVIKGSPTWAATSIATVLMVSIYAMGPVSGGNFNPAVSLTLALSGALPWVHMAVYWAVQLVAGIAAGFSYLGLFGVAFNLQPGGGYTLVPALCAELAYTFMLCFVVLNTAASPKTNGDNQFFGLAIGFVIVAGGYAAGGISGGAFNPAVALGIDVASFFKGGFCSGAYIPTELVGAALASALHRIVRPKEYGYEEFPPMISQLTSEFIGTFYLVLTVGLNVLGGSPAGAWSIAASLMCMIYSLGNVSGGHFNPAVTLSIILSGREKMTGGILNVPLYMVMQIVGAICAGLCYTSMVGRSFPLGPGNGFHWYQAGVAEFIFTFVLCFVVLNVATAEKTGQKQMFGLAIASCVTVGGCAIGAVSGGSLNPAVSFGIDTAHAIHGGGWMNCLLYSAFELCGAVLATGLFYLVHPEEYNKGGLQVRSLGEKRFYGTI